MSGVIVVVGNVGNTKVIGHFGVQHVEFQTTSYLEAHVVVVQEVLVGTLLLLLTMLILVLCLAGNAVCEIGTNERQNGNLVGCLYAILH